MPDPNVWPSTRAQLRERGIGDHQVDRLRRSGELVTVRRGLLAKGDADLDVQLRAARTAYASRELVASHLTAARLLGLPRPLGGWTRPEFTSAMRPNIRRDDVRITAAALPAHHVIRVGDQSTTSPARTVIDCLRVLPGRDALAVADAALHRRLVGPDELAEALAIESGWPGARRARKVLSLADPRRESPLESWSAWAFDDAGLPRPLWQVDVLDGRERFIGRCDCWWPGVAGEADGKSKYRLAAAEPGGSAARSVFDVLQAERAREKGLRDTNAQVERWSAADVLSRDRTQTLASRFRAAFLLAAERGPFVGRIRLT